MIDAEYILEEIGGRAALWIAAGTEDTDLAGMAEYALGRGMCAISVAPDAVVTMWPWLEKTDVKIIARFYMSSKDAHGISELTARVNATFKQGADGAQIFMKTSELGAFVDEVHLIRDDLFFNKDLSVGLDIGAVDAIEWGGVFANLRRINATSLILALPRDAGDKSDFVGRLYGALDGWDSDFKGDLHFALGRNFLRIEQAHRLVQKMRSEIADRTRFFLSC